MGTEISSIIAHAGLAWVWGYVRGAMCVTIVQLSGLRPAMLASSVQAVVACYATTPRVCTLVLFIASITYTLWIFSFLLLFKTETNITLCI